MKKVIHVNRHNITSNNRGNCEYKPVLTCKTYKANYRGFKVEILGPSVLVDTTYTGEKPLSCGARVWIETTAPVRIDNELTIP